MCLESDCVSIYVEHNEDETDKGKAVLEEEAYSPDVDEFNEYDTDDWVQL